MAKKDTTAERGGKAGFGITDIACIIVFLLLIFGFAVAMPLLPDREFSESEGHSLAQFPALSSGADKSIPEQLREGKFLDRFFDGSFMRDFTGYAADQFPLRDQFVEAKAYVHSRLFLGENNGYYLTGNGYIVKIDEEPDMVAAADNIGAVYALAEELGVEKQLIYTGEVDPELFLKDDPAFPLVRWYVNINNIVPDLEQQIDHMPVEEAKAALVAILEKIKEYHAAGLNWDYRHAELIWERAEQMRIGISVWTVDDPEVMARLLKTNADNITTNRVAEILRLKN